MIAVDFAEGSRSHLVMSVKDPFGDMPAVDLSAAPDLLFSALRGMMQTPAPASTSAPTLALGAEPAIALAVPDETTPVSFMPVAVLRRMRNPLYGMFGGAPA